MIFAVRIHMSSPHIRKNVSTHTSMVLVSLLAEADGLNGALVFACTLESTFSEMLFGNRYEPYFHLRF